ncbi:hypothetical protein EVAR_40636_1 [Eumeta japonica]|uniref:Uncharacterized protein n=1 Tax=Eumeta variegata TaxID=151549 RepID=A0A4C1X6W3_EUMVA|nr:hypothetical protein EVAR_40636_1 [Eumeta japonica]
MLTYHRCEINTNNCNHCEFSDVTSTHLKRITKSYDPAAPRRAVSLIPSIRYRSERENRGLTLKIHRYKSPVQWSRASVTSRRRSKVGHTDGPRGARGRRARPGAHTNYIDPGSVHPRPLSVSAVAFTVRYRGIGRNTRTMLARSNIRYYFPRHKINSFIFYIVRSRCEPQSTFDRDLDIDSAFDPDPNAAPNSCTESTA